jgi:hypothetical protein
MTTPTPEQIVNQLTEFATDLYKKGELQPSYGYFDDLHQCQATEIAALKSQVASAAEGLAEAYNFQSSGTAPSIHDYGRWRRIVATIEQLLKE